MKIIRIIGSLDFGGIEKVYEITAAHYSGDKRDMLFLCLGKGGAAERAIRELGYRVVTWNRPVRIPRIGLIVRLVALMLKERPDVVHTAGAEANFHGILAARISGVRVRVAEEIGMPAHSRLAKRVFRWVYKRASCVIAVAQLVEDYLLTEGEVRPGKVEVIYNPVDLRCAHTTQGERTIFRIVTVCRLDPIKNLDLLIRGLALLRDNLEGTAPIALWIVGDGPSRPGLEGLTRELGLSETVTFWGYQARPAKFLEDASLFVLPSFSEGVSIAVAEAMLAGTPCAVTRVGGAPEFIREGHNGWLLDPLDQEGFADLLRQIVVMPAADRRVIGEQGRKTAMDKFHPDKYMRTIRELYERMQHI